MLNNGYPIPSANIDNMYLSLGNPLPYNDNLGSRDRIVTALEND
jgi:hypothetical protein